MIRSRLGLKALGLCAMLVGMFAFASVAQAEPNAYWLANGAKFTSVLNPALQAETDVEGSLLTELGGKFIHIPCKKFALTNTPKLVEPLGQVTGKILFHECLFKELETPNGKLNTLAACEPHVGTNKGLIETNAITGLIKLHSREENKVVIKENVLEAKPTTAGGLFATISLGELPESECAFGEKITVGGVFFLRDVNGKFSTNEVKHLVAELPSLTKLAINGGAKVGTINGSAWAFLSGAHAGQTFSGQPG